MPKMSDGTPHFPVSMAVGDFNYDGYKNEVALAWSDIDHVHVKVLQLSCDGNFSYSMKEIYSSSIHNYTYNNIRPGRVIGYNLDGVTSFYSVSVVAGDFDGDHQDEFAVVFRDNVPSDSRIYQSELKEDKDHDYTFILDGLTGKIHIFTHKWNGENNFLTSEETAAHDSFSLGGTNRNSFSDFPVAVKAVAADINGDGRDDIATIISCLEIVFFANFEWAPMLQTASQFALVEAWSYDAGSIVPKQSFSYTVEKAQYGDEERNLSDDPFPGCDPSYGGQQCFLRDAIQRSLAEVRPDGSYPFMENEYDITAGKFTGRIGDVITADDLVIRHRIHEYIAAEKLNTYNYAISLISDGLKKITKIMEVPNSLVGFVPGNFLSEGVKLGEPIKMQFDTDLDYTAILQTVPYHVDTLAADGSVSTDKPLNFTLHTDTSVTYSHESSTSETKNLTYGMTKSAETIFALDCPFLRDASKTFQGIRGITSAVLGNSTAISKGMEWAGKALDNLMDTVTQTTKTSNENQAGYVMSITTKANYQDALLMSSSTRYLWRYPVLTYPVPDWILGHTKDATIENYNKSQVTNQQTYITFAMSEPSTLKSVAGVNDSHYQPYHEPGNLFSYPSAIDQTGGYAGSTYMPSQSNQEINEFDWEGADTTESLTFTALTKDQSETKKVNKTGAITNFLSMLKSLTGSDLAQIPQDSDSSFTRNVTDQEKLTVRIPEAFRSEPQFTMGFMPYLDSAGTTTVAFAVKDFDTDYDLWGDEDSLYNKMPDPSLLLPEKFDYSAEPSGNELNKGTFSVNPDDKTALKMRGLRVYLADYDDMPTDSPLMTGLRYKIKVPVYNASFVSAGSFKVRLSYSKSKKYNAQRTTIGEYSFGALDGWGKKDGNSRQFAEFEWTPDVDEGQYYLFAEIDPENELAEIHENQRDAGGDIVDYGGNNMGYFRVSFVTPDSDVYDRSQQLGTASAANRVMTSGSDGSAFPHIHWVQANGLDPDDFIRQEVWGAHWPVPVELEVKYGGDYVIPDAEMIGYKLKAEAKGKTVREVTDGDIELYFLMEEFDLFPGEEHKIHFRMDPVYLEDGPECIRFAIKVAGAEYPLTDSGSSSHGGGCEVGFGALAAALGVLGLALRWTRSSASGKISRNTEE